MLLFNTWFYIKPNKRPRACTLKLEQPNRMIFWARERANLTSVYYRPFDVLLKAGPAYIPRCCKHREVEAVNFDNQTDTRLMDFYHFPKYMSFYVYFFTFILHLYKMIRSLICTSKKNHSKNFPPKNNNLQTNFALNKNTPACGIFAK